MKIQILLSTYNGERFLAEQLDSFLTLEGADVSVLIRDDGSSDSTRDILCKYRDGYGFEVVFGENLGLNRSMYELVAMRDKGCDFFAFSDQDDVWLSDKLSSAIERLAPLGDIPALYAGSSHLTDEKLNITGRTSMAKRAPSFFNAMVENICIGHTLVLNSSLMNIYASHYSDGIFVFDYWAYLIASCFGKVIFDAECHTLYRQHGDNTIGYKSNPIGRLGVRIRRVFSGKSYYNSRQLFAFCESFGDEVPEQYRKETEDFFASERSFFKRLGYIFRTKAYRQGRLEGLVFRIMYLFGRYNFRHLMIEGAE